MAQGTGEGKRTKKEETMGHAYLKAATVRREGRAIGREGIDKCLGEIAAVHRCGQIADSGVGDRSHGHGMG